MTRLLRAFRALCVAGIVVLVAAVLVAPQTERVGSTSDDVVWRHLPTTTTSPTPVLRLVGQRGPIGA